MKGLWNNLAWKDKLALAAFGGWLLFCLIELR